MKNFLRALRHAWPYRRRFIVSVVCASLAAVLWGLNFTAIYPVLKLLNNEQTPRQMVDGMHPRRDRPHRTSSNPRSRSSKIRSTTSTPNRPTTSPNRSDATPPASWPASNATSPPTAPSSGATRSPASTSTPSPPPTASKPSPGSSALVVVGVAVKCFFEFGQESLVGSVVNLSLFDLRNRFYRNVIHLDVDQFGEQGTSELMARFTNDMESLGAGIKTLFGKVVAEPLRALACIVVRLLHQLAADADVPRSSCRSPSSSWPRSAAS